MFKGVCMDQIYPDRVGSFSAFQGRPGRPSLPGWSFLRFIYGEFCPLPLFPRIRSGQGLPP